MSKRKESKLSYTIDDFYDSYIEYVEDNELYKIDRKLYRAIVTDYFEHIADQVINHSREYKLPARMGTLFVFKRKPIKYNFRYLRVDFKSTNELNKTILHLNEHSNGYNYRFRWNKKDMMMKNSNLYELIMTRTNKRSLAKAIKEDKRDYIELK